MNISIKKNNLFCGPQGCTFKGFGKSTINSLDLLPFNKSRIILLHSGRTAINQAIITLGLKAGDSVLVPSYNCGTELDPLIYNRIDIKLYRITKSATIDMTDLESKIDSNTKAIYITHFFGFPEKSVNIIKQICNDKKIWLIEDCAHALLSKNDDEFLGQIGDLSIFSFIKSLPIPDGGALVINHEELPNSTSLQKPNYRDISSYLFYLTTLSMISTLEGTIFTRFIANTLGRAKISLSNSGNKSKDMLYLPDNQYYSDKLSQRELSWLSSKMMFNTDVTTLIQRRRENFEYLLQNLPQSEDIKPLYLSLPPGVCPLQFPVLVKDRDRLRHQLLKSGIISIRWWSKYHRDIFWNDYPEARFLKDNLMVLPIHQGLTIEHMEFISEVFKNKIEIN